MSDRFVLQVSSTSTPSNGEASQLIPSARGCEVFLSFRGPDTRTGFTDHLYTRLIDAGIKTFRDDNELRVGEEIGPELIEGINQSKIAIPIFSKGYAASKWCLKELAHIVECKRSRGLKVMPIFYDVKPSDVRNQTGDFAEAFASHEEYYDDETIRGWKEALKEVGRLKGWDIQSDSNRQQGKLVKEITEMVRYELRELKKSTRVLKMARTCFYILSIFFFILYYFIAYYVSKRKVASTLDEFGQLTKGLNRGEDVTSAQEKFNHFARQSIEQSPVVEITYWLSLFSLFSAISLHLYVKFKWDS